MDTGAFSMKKSYSDPHVEPFFGQELIVQPQFTSEHFLSQGETLLLNGDFLGVKFCNLAEKLQPQSTDLLYRIGLALSECGQSKLDRSMLLLACKKFRQALKKEPNHILSAEALGSNLLFLGRKFDEFHFYLEARKTYELLLKEEELLSSEILCEILTDYSSCLLEIGRHYQETEDFQIAYDRMQKASELKAPHSVDFWLLFGHIALEYGELINHYGLLLKSVDCYKRSIQLTPQNAEGWFYLAVALKYVYLMTQDEDHFTKSNECFASSITLNPLHYDSWLEWAHLLLESGRRLKDEKRLVSAIEKCKRAQSLDPDEVFHQTIWIEALVEKGLLLDSIDDLNDAETKALNLLDEDLIDPEIYAATGLLLSAFGDYFDDLDYIFQAIEKYQEGLAFDRKNDRLWVLLAESFCRAGILSDDAKMVEKSFFFFQKALYFKQASSTYFEYAKALVSLAELTQEKTHLHLSLYYFEQAFQKQHHVIYIHPEWLYQYAAALDILGDQSEDEAYYAKAIDILNHVLIIDPQFPEIHHKLAVIYSHLAELQGEKENFIKAFFHFQVAAKNDNENDVLLLDWALTLTNFSEITEDALKTEQLLLEAEYKLFQAAKLGNIHAYYHLAGIFALKGDEAKAMQFMDKAKELEALPSFDELLEDSWLENIKNSDAFRLFLDQLDNSYKTRRSAS